MEEPIQQTMYAQSCQETLICNPEQEIGNLPEIYERSCPDLQVHCNMSLITVFVEMDIVQMAAKTTRRYEVGGWRVLHNDLHKSRS